MGVKVTQEIKRQHYTDLAHINITCDKCKVLVFDLYRTEDYATISSWREYYFWCIQGSVDQKIFYFSLDGETYCRRCYSHYQPDREPEKPFMDIVKEELIELGYDAHHVKRL